MRRPMLERFIEKVDWTEPGEHWPWTGANNGMGYGQIWDPVAGHRVYAHRVSYELFVGPIPDGLVINHLCVMPSCVNPAHLETVTVAENTRYTHLVSGRGRTVATECPAGHPHSAENTCVSPNGRLRCRECNRIRKAADRARRLDEQHSGGAA